MVVQILPFFHSTDSYLLRIIDGRVKGLNLSVLNYREDDMRG